MRSEPVFHEHFGRGVVQKRDGTASNSNLRCSFVTMRQETVGKVCTDAAALLTPGVESGKEGKREMLISDAQVEHVAQLARLALSAAENSALLNS